MTCAIVQARLNSSRIKNKMLLKLKNFLLIEWVLIRLKKSKMIDKFILSIPSSNENDILSNIGEKYNYNIFRGSESNVLSRFYNTSIKYNASNIVRVCADNPLIDYNEVDNLITFFKNNKCDYAYNHRPLKNKYPDGLGAEIVTSKVLKSIYQKAKSLNHKEHIFNYIWDNINNFNIKTFNPPNKKLHYPNIKLDIDTHDDFNLLNNLNINIDINSELLIKEYLK